MSHLRPRLTFSNVISVIALFVALGGGAYAAVKLKPNQVKSKNIAPNAVQGVDANESTFGTVPRAANADNANNAANADQASSVNGFTENDFQFGDGFDNAIAGFVDDGVTGGLIVFEGAVGVDCDSTPTVSYDDTGGDTADTDLWVNGAHEVVPDGDPADGNPFDLIAPTGTDQGMAHVHIWGGAGTIADVQVDAVWNPTPTNCTVAFTSQQNLNGVTSAAATAARAKGGLSRGGLPDGWVNPSRTP